MDTQCVQEKHHTQLLLSPRLTFPGALFNLFLLPQPRLIQLCLQEADIFCLTWFFVWHGPLNEESFRGLWYF